MGETERVHVPLGADVELYAQMADWAPAIAGFLRFDLAHDTPGLAGRPGVHLTMLNIGDVALQSYLFVVVPFDYSAPAAYVQGFVTVGDAGGDGGYAHSFSIDQLNDWQGYDHASVGEGLFGISDPIVFRRPAEVRFYIADQQDADPGSTQGHLTIVLRVLPAPAEYPAAP